MHYPIVETSTWRTLGDESVGTKAKIWLLDDQEREWLFKHPRKNSGEHWAEKLGAEVAELIGIPHARVELAEWNGVFGSISLNFTPDRSAGSLVLGNALLSSLPGYDKARKRPRLHSVDWILAALNQAGIGRPADCSALPFVDTASDAFVGYLMLDAVIGNTDRHHENWGLLVRSSETGETAELAPSFDHASSLGRELSDGERTRRLDGRDRLATVDAYCMHGRSPLFSLGTGAHKLSVHQAFARARELRHRAAEGWLALLMGVSPKELAESVHKLPAAVASAPARRFAWAMLESNRRHLSSLSSS